MCNLYRLGNSSSEVASWFSAANLASNAEVAGSIYPGASGLVVANRQVRSMVWGFPLARKSEKTKKLLKPKPVNNARSDKLDSYMWRYSFEERRCLIPLNGWAEAEGERGRKTKTWLRCADSELFAVAGIWKESDDWGLCYSMVMIDSVGEAAEVHNRMPVVLEPDAYSRWVEGSPDEALSLCVPFGGSISVDRTEELWFKRA